MGNISKQFFSFSKPLASSCLLPLPHPGSQGRPCNSAHAANVVLQRRQRCAEGREQRVLASHYELRVASCGKGIEGIGGGRGEHAAKNAEAVGFGQGAGGHAERQGKGGAGNACSAGGAGIAVLLQLAGAHKCRVRGAGHIMRKGEAGVAVGAAGV